MKYIFLLFILITLSSANKFKYREFSNVQNFYSSITNEVIQLSLKYRTPPAVILAIAGLESGYGSGYVSQITGNILSLGANKNEIQLPSLNIPYCKNDKTKKLIFSQKEQDQCNTLVWKQRPQSLKKDYRPKSIAGSSKNLDYFTYNQKKFQEAKLKNIEDFLTKWLNVNHKYSPFRNTKLWLEKRIEKEGIDTLFSIETNLEFANKIGGHKNSFNYRDTWPKKVKFILQKTGLTQLCSTIYYQKKSFIDAWKQ